MGNSHPTIDQIHHVTLEAFNEFDIASHNNQEAAKVRSRGGKNLPQAASYGLLGFAIVLIIVQIGFYVSEALLGRDLSSFTFLSNLLPLGIGVGIYYYFNRKNSQEIEKYTQIADSSNEKGRKILLNNYDMLKLVPSDHWYPLATESLKDYLSAHPNASIDEALAYYNQLIETAHNSPVNNQVIDEYKKQTLQLYIAQRHQDFDEYLSDN